MPLTYIDIEREKTWRIGILFLVLLLLYFLLTAILGSLFLASPFHEPARFLLGSALIAFAVAGVHFWIASYSSTDTVVRALDASAPDPDDAVHRGFSNVMQELHVVTGNRRTIRGVVVPSLSMNALAAADLRGTAVIAVTEGLLSRLTRPQLEAVVAHEANHVLSGDCLEATVAASLFGSYSAVIEALTRGTRGRAYAAPALLLAWVLLKLSQLLNLFISREREYRADAAAVRMTRNPLALAEALHLLSRSWRGAGFIGSGLEMLCIVNPELSALDEREGFLSDLLSTHPPIRKRLGILLGMARVSIGELENRVDRRGRELEDGASPSSGYFALDPRQEWQGPFTLAGMEQLPWLSPLTWVADANGAVDRAWKDTAVSAIFAGRIAGMHGGTELSCPSCRQPLVTVPAAGTSVHRCAFCDGTLVESGKIPRLIARAKRRCSDRILHIARAVQTANQRSYTSHRPGAATVPLLACPRCGHPMARGFHSMNYLVEVDRCSGCGLTWFDRDELDLLLCMIEHRLAPVEGNANLFTGGDGQ